MSKRMWKSATGASRFNGGSQNKKSEIKGLKTEKRLRGLVWDRKKIIVAPEFRDINVRIQGVRVATWYENNILKVDFWIQVIIPSVEGMIEIPVQVKTSPQAVLIFRMMYNGVKPVIAISGSKDIPGDVVLEELLRLTKNALAEIAKPMALRHHA